MHSGVSRNHVETYWVSTSHSLAHSGDNVMAPGVDMQSGSGTDRCRQTLEERKRLAHDVNISLLCFRKENGLEEEG